MNPLERLREEEAALEAEMLGNQTPTEETQEVSATEAEGIEQSTEEQEAAQFIEEIVTEPYSEPEEDEVELDVQPQKKSRTNWKKRFTNYKSSTDATIHGLRQELTEIQAHIAALMEENYSLRTSKQEKQGDIFEGAFTEEDIDTFGADGLDVVKKAAKVAIEKQVKPLQAELQKAEQARLADVKRRAESDRSRNYEQFLSRLEAVVPDYKEINVDPRFLKFMDVPDEFSGLPKKTLFHKAEASGDVFRVADFFMEFKNKIAPKADTTIPKEMEKHITPIGAGGGAQSSAQPKASGSGEYYRQSDIDKFYNDVMKGRYAGRHNVIIATEDAIEAAYRDNRILHNQ